MLARGVRTAAGIILGVLGWIVSGVAVAGQEHLIVRADVMLYGDNTEFHNPFREGETIFGTAVRPALEISLNPRVSVTLGAVGNWRFGSEHAFDLARPVASVAFGSAQSSFVIGTLPWRRARPAGPDLDGPHGLLPPLQRETLRFERPYEAGLQWTSSTRVIRHEAWINWQRLNTAQHRERFDTGIAGTLWPGRVAMPFQLHIVHEGGQQFAAGPVADSIAAAVGGAVSPRTGRLVTTLEAYVAASRYVPDREVAATSRTGLGFFSRAAVEREGWRAHLLFWRGDDFIKDEGDPNYQSRRRDGTRYRGIRDYAEAGFARTFAPAPGVSFEAAVRLHRVERHYEYSYRLLCVANLDWRIRTAPAGVRHSASRTPLPGL